MLKFGKKKPQVIDVSGENKEIQPVPESTVSGQDIKIKPRKKRFYKRRWFKNVIRLILIAAIIFGVVRFVMFKRGRQQQEGPTVQTTSEVSRGSVDVRVTGSGTVQPIESYTLSPLVEGTILQCDYDQGQEVPEGALLYRFEDTDAKSKMKSAENSLRSAQRDLASYDETIAENLKNIETVQNDRQKRVDDIRGRIANLTVKAPISGVIEGMTAQVGKNAGSSLGYIQNYDDISVTVSFNGSQIQSISEGDRVTVGIASLMNNVGGKVVRKYSAPRSGADGTVMYNVKVKLDSGLNIAAGTVVSITVHTNNGDIECPTVGTITYAEPENIEVEEMGQIERLYVESGDTVRAGQTLAVLRNKDLEDQLENALEALRKDVQDAQKQYNESVIRRESYVEAVENAESNLEVVKKDAENYIIRSPVSGVILEKHYKAGDTFGRDSSDSTLMVVADMSAMVFTINVDELDISNIAEGQSVTVTADALPGEMFIGTVTSVSRIGQSEYGVTGYPVEITIDDIGNLMSGMNVTAEINVGSAYDVIVAPASAIFMMGDMYYATVVTPGEAEGEEIETQVQVEVGLHNTEYYEIKSGLNEGDILRDSGISSSDMDEMYYYW
ncbi:MAG: efflux RND transporter periplasmic adaptor subunit [Oscillospiraceae bacterium]|nr:efflux RND transporter periplasmic adaptor subunit [Oscillospiraceae bacterium]